MDQPNSQTESVDEQIERIARELEARRGEPLSIQPAAAEPDAPPDAPAQDAPPPATPPAATGPAPTLPPRADQSAASAAAPAAPAAPAKEPFLGYSALPPEARAQYDRLAAEQEKLRQDYNALYNRVAPTQRKLDQLLNERAKAPQAAAPSPTAATENIAEWFKRQSPARQQHYRDYPEEAAAAFEIARDLMREQMAEVNGRMEREIADIRRSNELAQLSAAHPDWVQLRTETDPVTGRERPATAAAAEYWAWVSKQDERTQAMATGSSALEISQVLSTYKWERQNPEYGATLELEPFQRWAAVMPREIVDLVKSPDLDNRRLVLSLFWRDYEEANGQAGAPSPQNPEAARAQEIADRRNRRTDRVAPPIRGSVSPAQGAAGGTSEDAAIESVYQMLKARRG